MVRDWFTLSTASARHMLSAPERGRHLTVSADMPGGMPGSSTMKMRTLSPGFGSCATKVYCTGCPMAACTFLYAVSLPVVGSPLPVTTSNASPNGDSSLAGLVTKTGGDWRRMRQQCRGLAMSPLLWSRMALGMWLPLGSCWPTQRLRRKRELS
eukprot:175532-Rhodomonas_salina.2